jgi:hypothetical protein
MAPRDARAEGERCPNIVPRPAPCACAPATPGRPVRAYDFCAPIMPTADLFCIPDFEPGGHPPAQGGFSDVEPGGCGSGLKIGRAHV